MSTVQVKAGRAIAANLGKSEASVDTSMIAGAELLIAICTGRLESGVAAEKASVAVTEAVTGLAALSTARESFVACHQSLATLRDEQGLDGDYLGCTPDKLLARAKKASPLKRVA